MSETIHVTEIPGSIINIFTDNQRDPDKDPGFMVTARLWDIKGVRIFEASFMFVGQSDHILRAMAENTGLVDTCTVYWKNRSTECSHDMAGLTPEKGQACEIRLHNLRQLS